MSTPPTEIDACSDMDPEKPLRLVSVIVELPVPPWTIARLGGVGIMPKSGMEFTLTWRTTWCDRVPFVPVTVTV